MQRNILWIVLCSLILVGCQGEPPTPVSSPSPAVTVVVVVATPVETPTLTETPVATPSPSPSATVTPPPSTLTRSSTLTRTPTRTPVGATATTRATATPRPSATPAPPSTLQDGDYANTGSVRIQFTVGGGGTTATGGWFSFHCQVDNALSTYGFTDPAAITGGKFEFGALPDASGANKVSMACTVASATQARCVITNRLATKNCLDTPATASRK
jgi:hypothetical protein